MPQPASKDAAWNKQALDYFNRWARHAEITGRFNLVTCQYLACMALEVDGEIFILKTEEDGVPKIQLIETHRIGSTEEDTTESTIIDGIRVNDLDKPLSYRLLLDNGNYRDLAARDVLHLFTPHVYLPDARVSDYSAQHQPHAGCCRVAGTRKACR